MSGKNPLGDRGKASEDAWIREQERLQREKAKREGAGGAEGEKKKCTCKKSGGQGDCACKKASGSCGA